MSRAPAVRRRLERLAAFTFAATIAVTGCAVAGDEDGEKQEQDLGGVHAMYGMPPPPPPLDAGHSDSSTPATDAGPPCTPDEDVDDVDPGGFHAMYGMPPVHPIHPCPVEDAGPPAEHDAGGFHAMYGMPPGPSH